jgi:manganese oxidase
MVTPKYVVGMESKDQGSGSMRVFDRLLVLVGLIGLAAMGLAVLAATRPAEASPGDTATTANIRLFEFGIAGDLHIDSGATVLAVVNEGAIAHNLVMESGPRTRDLNNGESQRLDVGNLSPGEYVIFCDIPGHRQAGMEAVLMVGDSGHGGNHGGGTVTWEEMEENMLASIAAFPAATEGTGNLPMQPTILPNGTKEFHLVVEAIRWEVEPGKVVDAVAYNGQIPGPVIRVNVGDRVRIVVENRIDEITSWHPHGVRRHPIEADGVGFITQPRPIRPGETWSVEFVAEEISVGMYHGHDMGLHQVPNGLAGAFIVGEIPIPEGWDVVAEEFIFLNDAGNIGFSLNGKSFPATTPYVLKQGQAMMVHYMHEGLMNHPMHLHNNRQLVIAKDGFPLESPYFVDTLDVAPGERYTVLVLAELPGVWVWHCHIFTHVERSDGSMFGMLTALIVEE